MKGPYKQLHLTQERPWWAAIKSELITIWHPGMCPHFPSINDSW